VTKEFKREKKCLEALSETLSNIPDFPRGNVGCGCGHKRKIHAVASPEVGETTLSITNRAMY
jgi:hypothetical protein